MITGAHKFTTYDESESLYLNVAKSKLDVFQNTHSKSPETLEFEHTKQNNIFFQYYPGVF